MDGLCTYDKENARADADLHQVLHVKPVGPRAGDVKYEPEQAGPQHMDDARQVPALPGAVDPRRSNSTGP